MFRTAEITPELTVIVVPSGLTTPSADVVAVLTAIVGVVPPVVVIGAVALMLVTGAVPLDAAVTCPAALTVTLALVYAPAVTPDDGRSAVTSPRNVGAAAVDPADGPAQTVFGDCVASVAVSVPDVVTGEFDTLKMAGSDNPTLDTVPGVNVKAVVTSELVNDKAPTRPLKLTTSLAIPSILSQCVPSNTTSSPTFH